jgi:hypothetical protein
VQEELASLRYSGQDHGGRILYVGLHALDCTHLADTGNPTHMACRDGKTGAIKANPKDPTGVCLDDTASGPFAK